MTRVGDADRAAGGFEDCIDATDEGGVGTGADGLDEVVKVGQNVRGRQIERGERADGGAGLPHDGRSREASAHDVPDDQGDPARGQRDDVEPVAADFGTSRSRLVTPGDVQAFDGGGVVR